MESEYGDAIASAYKQIKDREEADKEAEQLLLQQDEEMVLQSDFIKTILDENTTLKNRDRLKGISAQHYRREAWHVISC